MSDNTARSFRDKWEKNQDLAFADTLDETHEISRWILNRNGFSGKAALQEHLKTRTRLLDAGCGNGRATALLRECTDPQKAKIVAFDLVAAEVARKNLSGYANITVAPGDLLGNLSGFGLFDFIYCQEVLHHTADPRRAFVNLSQRLMPEGEIAIYVYKLKAPVREFTDDYIRRKIAAMPYDQAVAVCDQITAFGKALSESGLKINVPAVDMLEIPAGEYDIQRLIYHFFMKCFWNESMSFKDNSVINYDWYHPDLCSRHTLQEVLEWFDEAGLQVVHQHVDFYGITVRGVKPRNDTR